MSQERPDDSFSDSDDARRGAQDSGQAASHAEHHGFTIQTGGRNTIADTAERIGRVAGTAQRQVRRGIELVRPAASTGGGTSNARQKEMDAEAKARHDDAHRIGELSEFAAERLLLREQLQDVVSRSRRATRRMVTEHPGPILAALAGLCVALGVGLRVSSPSRR
jgi:hypothetical protein